jgi:hypothetical protein
MDIVRQALCLLEAVSGFAGRARQLYYAIVLLGHTCPACGGRLVMVREGCCRCSSCEALLDPTLSFQRCTACGGQPVIVARSYRCGRCKERIVSRFQFFGTAFDAEYFRRKMAESRQRKREQRRRVREMLAGTRSDSLVPLPADLHSAPGLVEALDGLAAGIGEAAAWAPQPSFDLRRYQRHLRAHIGDFPISLEEMPSLQEDARKDLIWRFVAAVFMAHAGLIAIWQEGSEVMVSQHEIDREG